MKAQSRQALSIADRDTFTATVSPSCEAIRADHNGLNAGAHVDRPHLMLLSFKSRLPGFGFCARLKFGRPVAAAEVGQVDGSLWVELPVENTDKCLGYVGDDLAAARRAHNRVEFVA